MTKDSSSLDSLKNKINSEYNGIEVQDIKGAGNGKYTMDIKVNHNKGLGAIESKVLASLRPEQAIKPHKYYETGAPTVITRDYLQRGYLDLANKSVLSDTPQGIFEKSLNYYKTKGLYGAYIDALTDFACKGFENDIDDPDAKVFFDSWCFDTDFEQVVWWIFFDFFRVGFVRTYRALGAYEPNINPFVLPGNPKRVTQVASSVLDFIKFKTNFEHAAKKNIWSKSYIPVAYTILNPLLIEVKGSLLFGQETVVVKSKAFEEVRKILEKSGADLDKSEKELLKILPKEWKTLIRDRKDIPLDPLYLGAVDYRRMPYERYPLPRGAKAFEAMEYKESLIEADYSTLDGISNYILKITVGSDEFPVTSDAELEKVAELFNTPSKSFDVVWNHTLNIEKVTYPEISAILGSAKYDQVNLDLNSSFGPRALVDGVSPGNVEGVKLATKRLIEEVNYARRQVSRWIYGEYKFIAQAMEFDRIPTIRFDDTALKDEIVMMSQIQGLIDRRIISYQTGLRKLGFDPKTIIAEMMEERPLVQAGDIGIIGSPYNPKATPPGYEPTLEEPNAVTKDDDPGITNAPTGPGVNNTKPTKNLPPASNVQPVQKTPKGTPSEGRPKGKPGKSKAPTRKKTASVDEEIEDLSQELKHQLLDKLSLDELMEITNKIINS